MKRSLLILSSFGAVVWAASPALAQTGACCVFEPPGAATSCFVGSSSNCSLVSGTYVGNGTSCRTATCPGLGSPRGACCHANGGCRVVSGGQAACNSAVGTGSSYLGDGTSCDESTKSGPVTNACPTGGPTVPAVGGWGLGGLALLLLSGVAFKFGRRRAGATGN